MKFQSDLLAWFKKNARPLPWRRAYRPYDVWISEIMLQQTQVDTALPYYRRWMKAFPNVKSLALADEHKVLKHWQGLGYYSRARNLMESARLVVKQYDGTFPSDFEAIRALKGIGPYTAGAIASIAFNQNRPIVDGNVLRVLSRVYAIKDPINEVKNRTAFWKLAESLIPAGRARDFNQSLMELGALVCTPRNPLCGTCPVRAHCKAFKQGDPLAYPVKKARHETVKIEAGALVVTSEGKFLVRRRPVGKIMGGLWEFPEWKIARNEPLGSSNVGKKTARLAEKELGLRVERLESLGVIRRSYTHHAEKLHVFRGDVASPPSSSTDTWPQAWITKKEFGKYPFSSAHAKIAKLIQTL